MKNRANINFLLAMLLVAVLVIFAIKLGSLSSKLDSGLDGIQESMSTELEQGEIDDVEGYGLIFKGIGYGLGAVANVALIVVIFLIGIYAFLLFLFALIARLVYAPVGGRLIAYRILMTVEYLLQLPLIVLLIYMLTELFLFKIFLFTLFIAAGLIYSAINTYSKRICTISKQM